MKKSFTIAISLSILMFIGCGGGGGSSSNPTNENTNLDTDSKKIDSKIANALANANSTQKDFIKKYSYYGYIEVVKGYNVQKGSTTYACEGVSYAGANKETNQIFLASIDSENDTSSNPIPKVNNKYIYKTDGEMAEFYFTQGENYLIGTIKSYEKEIDKNCTLQAYFKKR